MPLERVHARSKSLPCAKARLACVSAQRLALRLHMGKSSAADAKEAKGHACHADDDGVGASSKKKPRLDKDSKAGNGKKIPLKWPGNLIGKKIPAKMNHENWIIDGLILKYCKDNLEFNGLNLHMPMSYLEKNKCVRYTISKPSHPSKALMASWVAYVKYVRHLSNANH